MIETHKRDGELLVPPLNLKGWKENPEQPGTWGTFPGLRLRLDPSGGWELELSLEHYSDSAFGKGPEDRLQMEMTVKELKKEILRKDLSMEEYEEQARIIDPRLLVGSDPDFTGWERPDVWYWERGNIAVRKQGLTPEWKVVSKWLGETEWYSDHRNAAAEMLNRLRQARHQETIGVFQIKEASKRIAETFCDWEIRRTEQGFSCFHDTLKVDVVSRSSGYEIAVTEKAQRKEGMRSRLDEDLAATVQRRSTMTASFQWERSQALQRLAVALKTLEPNEKETGQ